MTEIHRIAAAIELPLKQNEEDAQPKAYEQLQALDATLPTLIAAIKAAIECPQATS